MKKRRGKGAETRKKILGAARVVFSNHPYHVASIRMVGKEGGVDHPLISYYFPNKEMLFEAVVVEMIDEFNSFQFSLYDGLDQFSIEEGLSMFIDKMMAFHFKSPQLFRTLMQNTAHVEKIDDIPGLPLLIEFIAKFMEIFQENISVNISTGEIGKLVYSFSALLINYLGAGSSYATVLGMEINSPEYRNWVKDTMNLLFLPLIQKMIRSQRS